MLNSSDQDHAPHFVRPDLVLNCSQMLSADDTSRQYIMDNQLLKLVSLGKNY